MNKLITIGSLGLAGLVAATGLVVAGAPASTARGGGDDSAVVRTVDDHGRHREAGDDHSRHHGRHHERHHEAGDDHGRHHGRHHEARDDRGHDDR